MTGIRAPVLRTIREDFNPLHGPLVAVDDVAVDEAEAEAEAVTWLERWDRRALRGIEGLPVLEDGWTTSLGADSIAFHLITKLYFSN